MTDQKESKTVAVVGAGLVGCLAALAFAKKGYKVRVYEARPDIRSPEQQAISNFRSINLAVSSRGILALEKVDPEMSKRVLKDIIPMYGRMVHDLEGNQTSQKYGLYGESINSIDRAVLNRVLLDELESAGIELLFDHKLDKADLKVPRLEFLTGEDFSEAKVVEDVDLVVGADGSFSKTRQLLQRAVNMNYSQEFIDHLYLELRIPPGKDGAFLIDPNHLHIWPRSTFMLIALANGDGSFTSTLFAPNSVFDTLTDDAKVLEFFETNFPDAVEIMGREDLLESFNSNPKSSLVCVKCTPYHYKGKCIIIGDAAHSMVPFYGQGMNCGFEDVRVLMELLEKHDYEFEAAFDEYTATRHEDLTAIIDLAMDNYIEMRHKVTSTMYLMRKRVDGWLSKMFKDKWLPLYTMVSFRPDISYSQAVEREARQRDILNSVLVNTVRLSAAAGVVAAAAAFVFNKRR